MLASSRQRTEKELKGTQLASLLLLVPQEPYAFDVGIQRPAKDAASFISVQDCTKACDDQSDCAGVTVLMTVEPWKIGTTCRLVFGDATPGRFKRSMIRADLERIGFRTTYLCPSGYTIQEDIITCTPINTVQAAVYVLTAQGTCDAATIQSVKDAITKFLTDATSAFGEQAFLSAPLKSFACSLVASDPAVLLQQKHLLVSHHARRLLRLLLWAAGYQNIVWLRLCFSLSAGVYVPNLVVEVSCISSQTTQVCVSLLQSSSCYGSCCAAPGGWLVAGALSNPPCPASVTLSATPSHVCMQAFLLDAGQRRLLAAAENGTTVAITVEAKYTGSQTGSKNVVDKLDRLEEAQCTVPGLCDNLEGASLRRSWTDPAAVQGGTLALTVQSVNESSVVVRAVYSEGGTTPVDMPIFIVLEDQDVHLPCVQSLDGVARLFTCVGPLASNITLKFTATAPNTIVLAEPLATSVTYTCE